VGNIKETPEEKVRARFLKYAKKSNRKKKPKNVPKSHSVRAASGGLPSLGSGDNFKLRHYRKPARISNRNIVRRQGRPQRGRRAQERGRGIVRNVEAHGGLVMICAEVWRGSDDFGWVAGKQSVIIIILWGQK
jgi:hypothetical protein